MREGRKGGRTCRARGVWKGREGEEKVCVSNAVLVRATLHTMWDRLETVNASERADLVCCNVILINMRQRNFELRVDAHAHSAPLYSLAIMYILYLMFDSDSPTYLFNTSARRETHIVHNHPLRTGYTCYQGH